MRLNRHDISRSLAVLLPLFLYPHAVFAAPLDKNACAALAQEMQNLQALNVQKLMERGPEWAVTNLSHGDLHIVRRYIEVDEQVKFRCTPASALVRLQGLEEEENEDDTKPVADVKPAEENVGDAGRKPKTAEPAAASAVAPVVPKRPAPKPQKPEQAGQPAAPKPVQANISPAKPQPVKPLPIKPAQ